MNPTDMASDEGITEAASLDAVLASLYDGVMAPEGFYPFIATLSKVFALRGAILLIEHNETHEIKGLWLHGLTHEWLRRYALDYAVEDVLGQHVMKAPIAQFYASNLDLSLNESFKRTRFFREWLEPQGIATACGAILLREGAWSTIIFLQRSPDKPEFSHGEVRTLNRLVPHMQRAMQMRQRFAELQLGQDFLAGGLNTLAMPAIFFDEHSRVAHMNERARAFLAESELLRVQDGHLVARDLTASRKLNFEISSAIQASRGDKAPLNEVVLIPRPERLPLMLMVTPVRLAAVPRQAHGAAMVFAFDPERAPSLTAERVRKLFGLTQAEASLAVALCSGMTLDEFAEERGVSPSTARTQLKSAFAKTGTKRQSELVSLLLASPAYFMAGTEAA